MTYFKAENNQEKFSSLYVPSDNVHTALSHMENAFDFSFSRLYHMRNLLGRLKCSFRTSLAYLTFPECLNVLDIIIDTYCKTCIYRAIKNMNETLIKREPFTKTRKYNKVVHT